MDMPRYWKLVEPYWEAVSIYDGEEVFLREFSRTPVASRNLLAAHWCQSEVCNGGFDQFFGNSTGILAPEAAVAFSAIGMPRLGTVVKAALDWFGPEYPRDNAVRLDQLEAHSDKSDESAFETLDDEFYELLESEGGGFEAAADRYAANNGG